METGQNQAGTKVDQGLQLFNTVQNRLALLNFNNTLTSILDKQALAKESEISLTPEEFEVLGGISYLVGLDFHGLTKWNTQTITNVIMRLLLNKVSAVNFCNYTEVLKDLTSLKPVSDARVELMGRIKLDFLPEADDIENYKQVLPLIKDVIKYSLVPVELSEDLYQRFVAKDTLTYHDFLVFNSFAYNDSIFGGKAGNYFIEVSNNPAYMNALTKASNFFELQKFGLFYEESILNFYTKNIENENELFSRKFFFNFLTDQNIDKVTNAENQEEINIFGQSLMNDIQKYFETKIQPTLSEEAPVKLEVAHKAEEPVVSPLSEGVEVLQDALENPLENPTEVIKHILIDFNKIRNEQGLPTFAFKEDPNELISSLESMLEVEDLIGSFYTFLSKYNEFKRTPEVAVVQIDTEKIFNYSLEELNTVFNGYIQNNQTKYNVIIETYIKEIPNEILELLLPTVNEILSKLYVGNTEDKGIILSQLNENTIFTYKHLHQVINTIEKQYIKGEYFNSYVTFKNNMETNHKDILELIDESQKLQDLELKIKLAHTFLSAFN